MGALSLQPLGKFFSVQSGGLFSDLANLPALKNLQSSSPPAPLAAVSAEDPTQDSLGHAGDSYESSVYTAQAAKISLAAQFHEVAARVVSAQDGGDGQASQDSGAQQVFSFFAQVKSEQVAVFQQRTSAVASGLSGSQQQSYIESSQRVAARFSLSVSVSGSMLNSFASTSEGLQNIGKDGLDKQLLDAFLGATNDALKKTDDIVNQIFDLFSGFLNGTSGADDFEKRFSDLIARLQKIDLSGFFGTTSGAQQGNAGSGQTGTTQVQVFGVNIQLEFEFSSSSSQVQVQQSDPVTLDLNGDGINLTSYLNGAQFDITGSGTKVNTAFVTGGDAFLALDRNGNGSIDSGKELFGDQNGAKNGYEELRKLDSNGDGVINALDKDFDKLTLFKDNGNGVTEKGELVSLADAGITEISLAYKTVNTGARGGNHIGQVASYTRADGKRGLAADTILNYTA